MHLQVIPIVTAATMGGNITSTVIDLDYLQGYAVQAVWTGTPTGSLAIQVSNDQVVWSSLAGVSPVALSGAAGNTMFNVPQSFFRYTQLVYTFTSGTGTLSANACVKAA